MAKGSRPSGGGGGGKAANTQPKASGIEKQLQIANTPVDPSKTGANYEKLPAVFKRNIDKNLIPSEVFTDYANASKPAEDIWTVGLKGVKRKQKVFTNITNGKLTYTVKEGNKTLLKTGDKNKVANKVAEFYNQELKKAGVL